MNTGKTIKKLQTALRQKGRIIKINTYQFYSEEQGRFITKSSLVEKQPRKNRMGEQIMKNIELLNTCSHVEVIKFLAELYKGGDG